MTLSQKPSTSLDNEPVNSSDKDTFFSELDRNARNLVEDHRPTYTRRQRTVMVNEAEFEEVKPTDAQAEPFHRGQSMRLDFLDKVAEGKNFFKEMD